MVSYSVRVRVTATDKAGNTNSDTSNADFFIPTPYLVTNTADTGAGSLRQAITDANAAGGNRTIGFNIPVGASGVAAISVPTSLSQITQSGIIIDGQSQTVLVGNTNVNGPEVRITSTGSGGGMICFDIIASNVAIKNLQIVNCGTAIRTNAANTVIDGNHIGISSDSTGLSACTSNQNGTGVVLAAAATNATVGGSIGNFIADNKNKAIDDQGIGTNILNNTIGLYPNGTLCANSTSGSPNNYDIWVHPASANNCTIQGNTICGSGGDFGIYLGGASELCKIQGNLFGLRNNAGTLTQVGPHGGTIAISSSGGNNTVGGQNVATSDTVLNDSNVFNFAAGGVAAIQLNANNSAKPNKVYGNFIGTNTQKLATYGGSYGVRVEASYNIIGGFPASSEAGNVITNMSSNGVYIDSNAASYVKISNNSIYGNGGSLAGSDDGIALVGTANQSITRPTITAASAGTPGSVTVGSVASGDTVEVYLSDYSGSGTQNGEGKTFKGTNGSSGTSVVVSIPTGLTSGQWITAIRTNSANSTSPFSANFHVP